jgi:hypothetical protein
MTARASRGSPVVVGMDTGMVALEALAVDLTAIGVGFVKVALRRRLVGVFLVVIISSRRFGYELGLITGN